MAAAMRFQTAPVGHRTASRLAVGRGGRVLSAFFARGSGVAQARGRLHGRNDAPSGHDYFHWAADQVALAARAGYAHGNSYWYAGNFIFAGSFVLRSDYRHSRVA